MALIPSLCQRYRLMTAFQVHTSSLMAERSRRGNPPLSPLSSRQTDRIPYLSPTGQTNITAPATQLPKPAVKKPRVAKRPLSGAELSGPHQNGETAPSAIDSGGVAPDSEATRADVASSPDPPSEDDEEDPPERCVPSRLTDPIFLRQPRNSPVVVHNP